jgi:hypothetical protein
VNARKNRTCIGRFVYWANTGAAWPDLAQRAGYEIDWYRENKPLEAALVMDGEVVGQLRRVGDGEWFGFSWVPEARTPSWRQAIWRLRQRLGTDVQFSAPAEPEPQAAE